jgi:PPK2 family polyphosphate:nucleotide phosphotransferase
MSYVVQLPPGIQVKLSKIPTDETAGLTREAAAVKFEELAVELGELQELLYGAGTHSLLVVLQGLDTSGKDGTIRGVFRDVNPAGCIVNQFKTPNEEDLAHDFLWRVHPRTPALGMISVFNRSHYEDVLIVRVKELVPETVWRKRFDQINDFERLLVANNTLVAKFYLHISEDEQKKRLLERERKVEKAWKLSAQDWIERRSWSSYWTAYEDALSKCTTAEAPWRVVPADRKWFRNLAITEDLVKLLSPFKKEWLDTLKKRGENELAAIKGARETGKISV